VKDSTGELEVLPDSGEQFGRGDRCESHKECSNEVVDHMLTPQDAGYFLHVAIATHSHTGAPGTSAWVQSQLIRPILNKLRMMQRLDAFSMADVQAPDLEDAVAVAVRT
jgi:hypothetical protein